MLDEQCIEICVDQNIEFDCRNCYDLFVVIFKFLFCMSCGYKEEMSEIKLCLSPFYVNPVLYKHSCSVYKSSPLVRLSYETDLDLLNYLFRAEEMSLSHVLLEWRMLVSVYTIELWCFRFNSFAIIYESWRDYSLAICWLRELSESVCNYMYMYLVCTLFMYNGYLYTGL